MDLQEASQNSVALGHWQTELAEAFSECTMHTSDPTNYELQWSDLPDTSYFIGSPDPLEVIGTTNAPSCYMNMTFSGYTDLTIDGTISELEANEFTLQIETSDESLIGEKLLVAVLARTPSF